MSGIIIANKNETISISAPDIYGASFNISILSQATNSWIITNQPMTEYLDIFITNNQTVQANGILSDTSITISNATNFNIGDIINIKNFYYRINNISGNIITLHTGLQENILIGDIANRSGNMALYYIQLNITTPGDYLIRAKDSIFGIEITDSIKVVQKSIETMAQDIRNLEYAILGN